jgi:hypothetical protein
MPVFNTDKIDGPAPELDIVTVRVTKRGHGKVSTGNHSNRHGEEYFAEGETFEISRRNAEELASDAGDAPRMYVEIVKKPAAKG